MSTPRVFQRLVSSARLVALGLVAVAATACSSSGVSTEREPAVGAPAAAQASPSVAADAQRPLPSQAGETGEPQRSPSSAASVQDIPSVSSQPSPLDKTPTPAFNEFWYLADPQGGPGEFEVFFDRDTIVPVYSPTIRAADEVTELAPRELVIGVSVDGQSRAYPVRPLRSREMVNDELGGVPILVTW